MTDVAVAPGRTRLPGDERRRQLLDTAARLLVHHGTSAMSMERLAAEAGVSKALPYKHFDNAEAVLVALYRREASALGRSVWRALREAPAGSDLTRLAIRTYFDELARRRQVLVALTGPGSTVAAVADADHAGVAFEVEVFTTWSGVDRDRAEEIAGVVQGAIVGAAGSWLAGRGRRERLEDDLVWLVDGLLRRR